MQFFSFSHVIMDKIILYDVSLFSFYAKSFLVSTKKRETSSPEDISPTFQSAYILLLLPLPTPLPNPHLHLPQHILRSRPLAHLHHSHNDHHLVVEVVFEFSLVGLEIFHEF